MTKIVKIFLSWVFAFANAQLDLKGSSKWCKLLPQIISRASRLQFGSSAYKNESRYHHHHIHTNHAHWSKINILIQFLIEKLFKIIPRLDKSIKKYFGLNLEIFNFFCSNGDFSAVCKATISRVTSVVTILSGCRIYQYLWVGLSCKLKKSLIIDYSAAVLDGLELYSCPRHGCNNGT